MNVVLQGAFWLALYLALVLGPLAVLILAPSPGGAGFWWDFAMGMGFAGLVMMGIQFLLTARFRRATAPCGIDLVYYVHRYLAYALVGVVLAHAVIPMVINPALRSAFVPFTVSWPMTAGSASLLCLLALVVSSAGRKRLRIPYEAWRVAHLALGVAAVALAFVHMISVGHYTATPVVRALWLGIGLSLLGIVLWLRVIRPWRLLRTPYRVTEVRPELGSSWTVVLEPVGHDGFAFEPGQFAWVTIGRSPFAMQEHPFSIASAPAPGGRLEFTIKELGDFTQTVGRIPVGERAYVDGPYGAFSIDRQPDAAGYVFIGGGIGIAPMTSMLRALAGRGDRRPHLLFAAHSRWDRVPLRDEVRALAEQLDLKRIHVLEEPPEDWSGERGRIDADILERHLPDDRGNFHYFVCGPVPMIRAVERLLVDAGVPRSRIHTELFDLA
ncbi:MAG: oxidoreductase [Deltaproteobacteria bacterium]|nr:MAG: oxidoreductase [Deltaproteobacteria bacterium]